jgi:hypothetical protein
MSYMIALLIVFLLILIFIIYTAKGEFDKNFVKKIIALILIFGLLYLLIDKFTYPVYDPDIIHPASL